MFQGIDPSLFPVLKTRRALIIVDAQNDFLSNDGALRANMPDNLTERIVRLVKEFRPSGDIVWIRSEYHQPRLAKSEQIITSDAPAENSRIASTSRGRRKPASAGLEPPSRCPEAFLSGPAPNRPDCVRKDTEGAQFPAAIQELVEKKDMVFVKSHYSAFQDYNLIQRLRMKFVSEVFICGSLSNMGVMATAIDAGSHGVDIGIIEDCCGYRDRERHDAALTQIQKMTGCEVLSTDRILDRVKPKPRVQRMTAPIPNPRGRRYPTVYEASPSVSSEKTETEEHTTTTMTSKLDYSEAKDTEADKAESDLPPIVFTRARVAARGRPPRSSPDVPKNLSDQFNMQGGMDASPNDDLNAEPGEESRKEGLSEPPLAAQAQSAPHVRTKENVPETPRDSANSSDSSKKHQQLEVETALEKLSLRSRKRDLPGKLPDSPSNDPGSGEIPAKSIEATIDPVQEIPAQILSYDTPEDSSTSEPNDSNATTSEPLCEGDTKVLYNVLPQPFFNDVFEKISNEVDWKRMSHQGGEVPRLVAVQGEVDVEGNIPIYRHPADESPPLQPWTSTVNKIKNVAEDKVGHPLNHALIQFYRDGNDYISEHSDKTLDIAKGSFIVNISLGAERTMILRTKRQPKKKNDDQPEPAVEGTRREVQRAPLPHNSMCKMGLQTNKRWLHAIRQDKRLDRDKTEQELAYNGARISLTFRQIGTFLDRNQKVIWGQGAKGKTKTEANEVINGQSVEAVQMLKAFGRENQSTDFDWDEHYGQGFDVLHISAAPRLFTSSDPVANMRVQFMLAEMDLGHAKGSSAPVSTSRSTSSGRQDSNDPLIKFLDNDEGKSVIMGDMAIMLYLNHYYNKHSPGSGARTDLARIFTRFNEAFALGVRKLTLDHMSLKRYLDPWEAYAGEADFITGASIGIADFAFWPVLYDITEGSWSHQLSPYPNLKAYFARIRQRDPVIKVFGKDKELIAQTPPRQSLRSHNQPSQEAPKMPFPRPASKLMGEDLEVESLGIGSREGAKNKTEANRGLHSGD